MASETSPERTSNAYALAYRLWREEVLPFWPQLLTLGALIGVLAVVTSIYPIVIKQTFDAFASKELSQIWLTAGAVVAVTALKGFALLGQTQMTNRVVTRIEADMQKRLYGRLLAADVAQLARETVPSLTQRFTTDFLYVREALTRFVNVVLRDTLIAVALIGAMFWFDWRLTLICLGVTPIFAVPIARIGRKLRRIAGDFQTQSGTIASLVTESLGGIRVAKTYRLESYLKDRAGDAFEQIRRLKMKAASARSRLDPLLEIGVGIAIAGVFVFVGHRIAEGSATVGDFMGFLTALFLAAQPIRSIGNLNAILQEAASALMRLYALMDEAPTIVDRPGATPLAVTAGEIVFENLRFRYRDDAPALENVEIVAPGGRTTAIVGRSGSGKSTLAALVPRLYEPQAGRILIDGQDIATVTLSSLRSAIAVVSQDIVLFNDTIRANIALGRPGASDAEIVAAAEAAAAHGFISALPEGYETEIGERGGKLSGGERQRIALARAFLKDAPILLLDEATSSLDAESERLVQEAVASLMQGRTSIVVAHRLSTIRNADQIVVMEAGRAIETGTHASLIARPQGAYARLQQAQISGENRDTVEALARAS